MTASAGELFVKHWSDYDNTSLCGFLHADFYVEMVHGENGHYFLWALDLGPGTPYWREVCSEEEN